VSPVTADAAAVNRLLASLPSPELEHVSAALDVRELRHGETLIAPWEPITELYFPIDCIISIVSETPEGQSVEVATVGREGMVGAAAFLGSAVAPLRTMCQVAGPALVGRTVDLVEEDGESAFRATILRYSHTMLVQASVAAACNRLHPLEQRAARWLLTTSDALEQSRFTLTHEFFAIMLGAHRPSVSLAAQMLQQAGLITYHRGEVEILDHAGLTDAACSCYLTIAEHYKQTMGIRLGADEVPSIS
jgi:CRP-like cAMP-binding protein